MSKYTTEVRYICESYAGLSESKGYDSIEETIASAIPYIFNDTWTTFDPTYKTVLEKKIIRHFYTREIGFETVGLWKLKLNSTLSEIMPKYNKMYRIETINFNPLWDTDITKTFEGTDSTERDTDNTTSKTTSGTKSVTGSETKTGSETETHDGDDTKTISSTENTTGSTEGTGTDTTSGSDSVASTGENWDYYSDTPQGSVSRLDNLTYLTNARNVTDTKTDTTTYGKQGSTSSTVDEESEKTVSGTETTEYGKEVSKELTGSKSTTGSETTSGSVSGTDNTDETISTTKEFVQHITGKTGTITYGKVVQDYINSLFNVDQMIIEELEPLFMQLW